MQRALVQFDGARYSFHTLLRQYAYTHLAEREDVRPIHQLAAEHLQAKITGQNQGGTPEEGLEEVDQWERAQAWETFARRASALVGSLDRHGYWGEIAARLHTAQTAAETHLPEDERLWSQLISDRATIASKSGEWDKAIDFYQQSLATLERVGDVHGMAQTYGNLGTVYESVK